MTKRIIASKATNGKKAAKKPANGAAASMNPKARAARAREILEQVEEFSGEILLPEPPLPPAPNPESVTIPWAILLSLAGAVDGGNDALSLACAGLESTADAVFCLRNTLHEESDADEWLHHAWAIELRAKALAQLINLLGRPEQAP